tara:strand:- start:3936 stop:4688 length:753 start_codon:yes stop_codon:yes gene_type:complete
MNSDDVFFPYLLKLYADYLADMGFEAQEGQERGPQVFVEWLRVSFPESPLEEDEEESEEPEERTPEGDALFLLSSFLHADPGGGWIQEFWSSLMIAQRGTPRHPVAEIHVSYLVRWADDRLFSFMCVLPPHMLKPKGILSDYLVTKIGGLSASQFHDMVAERPLDLLHDIQQVKIPKEDIEEVLRLAVAATKDEPDAIRRESLQHAIHLLRSIALPPLPPEAELSARQAMTGNRLTGGNWDVLSSEGGEE